MKTLILIVFCGLLTACQSVPGHDGRTYYWIAPIPSTPGSYAYGNSGVNIYQGTLNGRGYQIVTPVR